MNIPQIAQSLKASGLGCFPCRADKSPAVSKGEGWKEVAEEPLGQRNFPTGIVGVPVPQGVVIVDLDTYKGVTRQDVEQIIGCALPWDAALIQTTMQGGQHYAFRVDRDILQMTNRNIKGFDTRAGGKGYIATGDRYTHVGFGPYRMARPESLPVLPAKALEELEVKERPASGRAELPQGDRDVDSVVQALRHIDPECTRAEWVLIGMGLKHHFHDEYETGLSIFESWSNGDLWQDGEHTPSNYVPEDTEGQWSSFKSEGGTTIGTLFHTAMANGWRPPVDAFDAAGAFGTGAADADAYCGLIDEINMIGGDPKETPALIDRVLQFPGSAAQVAMLKGLLERVIKDSGNLNKAVREQLNGPGTTKQRVTDQPAQIAELPDVMTAEEVPERMISKASASHGANAALMIGEVFGDRVASFSGVLRWWSGQQWQTIPEDKLKRLTSVALMPEQAKAPNVNGTINLLPALCDVRHQPHTNRLVYFKNGVLDMDSGEMRAHDIDNNNTGCLSVSYVPNAPVDEWYEHLNRLFYGLDDGEERVMLLQEALGWSLITDNLNIQKVVAFDGATRAGKGVILDALSSILGDKAVAVSFHNSHEGKTQSVFRQHDVAIDFEAKTPQRQSIKEATGFINKVASNEPVSIQLLNTQTPWSGRLDCKMFIACNGLPVMVDDSGASAGRFEVLRFDRSFEGKEDTTIGKRIAKELEGIAAWSVEGLRRLMANGRFTSPRSSREAMDDLKDASQPLKEFLRDKCTFGTDEKVHTTELWNAYQQYAFEANVKKPTRQAFIRSVRMTLLGGKVSEKKSLRIGDKVSTGFEGIGCETPLNNVTNIASKAFQK